MEKAVPGPPPLPPPLPPGAPPPPALCIVPGAAAAPGRSPRAPPCAPRLGRPARTRRARSLAPGPRWRRGAGSAQCGFGAALPLSHKEGGGGRAGGLGVSPSGLIHLPQITLHFLPPPAAAAPGSRSLRRARSQRPGRPSGLRPSARPPRPNQLLLMEIDEAGHAAL